MLLTDALKHLKYRSGGCFLHGSNKRHPTRRIDTHELIIVRHAELHMFEDDSPYHLLQHQFLYLDPQREHGGLADYHPGLSFYWFHFNLAKNMRPAIKSGHFKRPEIAADIASRLLDEQERSDAPVGSCDALLYTLILETTQIQDAQQHDPNGLIDQANIFIRSQFRQPIGTSDVAAHCGCHPDHLGRLYQARMHMTVSEAIRDQRLRLARSLLRDSNLNIDQIAREAGFSESHYFRRCFKASTGSSPAAWRSMHCRQFTN